MWMTSFDQPGFDVIKGWWNMIERCCDCCLCGVVGTGRCPGKGWVQAATINIIDVSAEFATITAIAFVVDCTATCSFVP